MDADITHDLLDGLKVESFDLPVTAALAIPAISSVPLNNEFDDFLSICQPVIRNNNIDSTIDHVVAPSFPPPVPAPVQKGGYSKKSSKVAPPAGPTGPRKSARAMAKGRKGSYAVAANYKAQPAKRKRSEHKKCPHGKRPSRCVLCGGSEICIHKRIRISCRECKGASICEHGRQRNRCRDCGGSQICEHGRERNRCKECGGSQICIHKRVRGTCRECGGSQICEHDKRRSRCKICKARKAVKQKEKAELEKTYGVGMVPPHILTALPSATMAIPATTTPAAAEEGMWVREFDVVLNRGGAAGGSSNTITTTTTTTTATTTTTTTSMTNVTVPPSITDTIFASSFAPIEEKKPAI